MTDPEYGSIENDDNKFDGVKSDPRQNLVICGKEINMTSKELIASILLSSFFFLNWSYYSLFPPFFPHEALKKDMNHIQIGFVFGTFQLVLFLLYPVFGKYMKVIGIKFLFVGGLFLASIGAIAFGFVDRLPSGTIYFVMSIFCRTVTGVGASMGISYAIVAYSFPNNVASVVAVLEFFSGIGFMTGPVLGGILFEIGGFELPFFTFGGLMFMLFLISVFWFPNSRTDESNTLIATNESNTLPIIPFLKIPQFSLTLLVMFVSCFGINFLEPNLQIHLLPLGLKPMQLGFVFFTPAITYTVFTPIVGFICDKRPETMPYFMIVSSCISIVAYSILGPFPYLDLPLKMPSFLVGYVLFGLSYTGVMVPVYSELTKITRKHGYANDLKLQGVISGIFSGVHSLAAFLGPMVGGFSVQLIGYRMSVFVITIMIFSTGLLYTIVYFSSKRNEDQTDEAGINAENNPLLKE